MILTLGIILSSCSSEDEPSAISVSSDFIEFGYEGGNETITISSSDSWTFDCSDEWITVRRNQNNLRIIAEENISSSERTSNVSIIVNGEVKYTIEVKQNPLIGFDDNGNINVPYNGGRFALKHNFKTLPLVSFESDWLTVSCETDSIIILVERNYDLNDRNAILNIDYKNHQSEIKVSQSKSPWYESIKLIYVEGGSFHMGAQSKDKNSINFDPDAFSVESPVHKTNINSFYISAFEITQEQWIEAMGLNPSLSQLGGKYPIENISWNEVNEFIQKLNQFSGKNYRLPTEAEWEFASKGGIHMESFYFSGSNVPSSVGWFYSNSDSKIHEVGQKAPNTLGIYDMTGNVSEWVQDWFNFYEESEQNNPSGPAYGDLKINRGGSCIASSKNCRNTYRSLNSPNDKSGEIGFRLVLTEL